MISLPLLLTNVVISKHSNDDLLVVLERVDLIQYSSNVSLPLNHQS